MDFTHLTAWAVALAPTFLSVAACLVVEGPAILRVLRERLLKAAEAFRKDHAALEVAAEALVHLSTYGSAVLVFVLGKALSLHMGALPTAGLAVVWFLVMLRLAYKVRKLAADSEADEG